jgi:integrase
MTINEAVAKVKSIMGDDWPKMKPVPEEAIIPVCEALWAQGIRPNIHTFAAYFPGAWIRGFVPGITAWRIQRGFRRKARYPAIARIEDLAPHIAPEIANAPFTCFDPLNDGRWPVPPARVIGYVRGIENMSLRNTVALFTLLKDLTQHQFYARVVAFTSLMRQLMTETGDQDLQAIDPDNMFRRILDNEIGKGLTLASRAGLFLQWNSIRYCFEDYAQRLSPEQRQIMEGFFIRAVQDRRRMAKSGLYSSWRIEREARVKARTEVVHDRFYQLRYIARIRLNQAKRMYEATEQAVRHVVANRISLPYDFSYDETGITESGRSIRQRIHLTLWDPVSRFTRLLELGYSSIDKSRLFRKRSGEFAPERVNYQVEYRHSESLDTAATVLEPWFLEPCACYVFSDTERLATLHRRHEFYRRWGYENRDHWDVPMRIVGWGQHLAEWDYLRERGHMLFSAEGVYVAALFGHLTIRLQTITGARLGEIQQIAQNPECIKQLVNVGPKAATRWLLRLVPKGEQKERQNYYIDEDSKSDLMDVIAYLRRKTGQKKLPIVETEFGKTSPDRYVFQWEGKPIDQAVLNGVIRFVLHGCVIRSTDGQGVHLTSHLLRHGFATEMARRNVPIDVIAAMLHQRDTTVTQYYSRPTQTQVLEAAEIIFVDRIDVAAEAIRNPSEIGRMLDEAQGKVGALTEVLGGSCVVANLCPAKFACIGCAGNAPDPNKRYQVEAKRKWAQEHAAWATTEGLRAEERQLKMLVQDCDLMLEEMSLIEKANRNADQSVVIRDDGPTT